jgi:hypothetical protein
MRSPFEDHADYAFDPESGLGEDMTEEELRFTAMDNIANRTMPEDYEPDDVPMSAQQIDWITKIEIATSRAFHTPAQWKEDLEVMREMEPEMWKRFYPRIYPEPPSGDEYCSPKEPANILLFSFFKGGTNTNFRKIAPAQAHLLAVGGSLAEYAMPHIWIRSEMAEAINQTDPPLDLDWTTMELPFPGMILMLPSGALTHAIEGEVQFLIYCRRQVTAKDGNVHSVFDIVTNTDRSTAVYEITDSEPIVPLGNLGRYLGEVTARYDHPLTAEDRELQKQALHLIFGSLLVMAARPKLVTQTQLIRRVHTKRETPKEFWTPRILGEHYRIRREHVSRGGHHGSPRFHWVRGHYRDQPHGPARQQRRLIWIDPHTKGVTANSDRD